MDHIFSNCGSISNCFAERFKKLEEENALNLAVLLLCSASGWKKQDELIGQMISKAPALKLLHNRIVSGMGIEEVSQEFCANDTICKALEQFRDIGFQDLNEEKKTKEAESLISSVQRSFSKIGFVDNLLSENISRKELELFLKKVFDDGNLEKRIKVEPIDPRKEYPPRIFIFSQITENGEKPFIPIRNLTRVKAPIKQGKSKLADVLASFALSNKNLLGVKSTKKTKVIIFDTEQDEDDVKCRWIRIARFANLSEFVPCDNLSVYPMEDALLESKDGSLGFIEETIITESSSAEQTLVIIDGINDLGEAELDKDTAKCITMRFKKLAKDTNSAIVGVIHQNRNSETTKGWLGLIWDEKSTSLLNVSKDKSTNVFTINMEPSRHGEIEPIRFCLDDYLTISSVSETELQDIQKKCNKQIEDKDRWRAIFGNDSQLSSTELSKREVNKAKAEGRSHSLAQARNIISDALKKEILIKGSGRNGLYSIVPNNAPIQTELIEDE